MWIQDFVGGMGSASEAESCRHSEASYLWTGPRAHLVRVLEAFGFLMLNKNAFQWDAYRPLVDRIPVCTVVGGVYLPRGVYLPKGGGVPT